MQNLKPQKLQILPSNHSLFKNTSIAIPHCCCAPSDYLSYSIMQLFVLTFIKLLETNKPEPIIIVMMRAFVVGKLTSQLHVCLHIVIFTCKTLLFEKHYTPKRLDQNSCAITAALLRRTGMLQIVLRQNGCAKLY